MNEELNQSNTKVKHSLFNLVTAITNPAQYIRIVANLLCFVAFPLRELNFIPNNFNTFFGVHGKKRFINARDIALGDLKKYKSYLRKSCEVSGCRMIKLKYAKDYSFTNHRDSLQKDFILTMR